MIVLFAIFVILLGLLIWITHTPVRELFRDFIPTRQSGRFNDTFAGAQVSLKTLELFADAEEPALDRKSVAAVAKLLDIKEGEPVDPHIVFGKLRGLIDKYDNPDFTKHIQRISGMDPGQLARMQL